MWGVVLCEFCWACEGQGTIWVHNLVGFYLSFFYFVGCSVWWLLFGFVCVCFFCWGGLLHTFGLNDTIFVTNLGLLCYNVTIWINHHLSHYVEPYTHSTLFFALRRALRTTITRVRKVLIWVGTLWALVILNPWAFGKSHAIHTWTHSPHQKVHPCLGLCTSHHTTSVVHRKLLLICERTWAQWLINPF
jgi:hypothetical protein